MLRPPHTSYNHLYVYHLDIIDLPKITDPDLIGVWIEDDTSVLFFHAAKKELVTKICRHQKCSLIYEADLSYDDWEAGQQITSFAVGTFRVSPLWEEDEADIRLDPSVIFGSGFHPTTRSCLRLVDKYVRTPELAINSMLDLGTGTGLLSIAAAKHGVSNILAMDNNPLACEVANANCLYNQVDNQVTVKEIDLRRSPPVTEGIDLLVANLYRGLLKELFTQESFWRANLYILSGFMRSMEADLLAAIPAKHLKFLERTQNDNWCIWVLAPKHSSFMQA